MDDVGDTSTEKCWYSCVRIKGQHIEYCNVVYNIKIFHWKDKTFQD